MNGAQLTIPLADSPMRAMPDGDRLRLAYLRCPSLWRRYGFDKATSDPLLRRVLALTADSMQRKDEATHGR